MNTLLVVAVLTMGANIAQPKPLLVIPDPVSDQWSYESYQVTFEVKTADIVEAGRLLNEVGLPSRSNYVLMSTWDDHARFGLRLSPDIVRPITARLHQANFVYKIDVSLPGHVDYYEFDED